MKSEHLRPNFPALKSTILKIQLINVQIDLISMNKEAE